MELNRDNLENALRESSSLQKIDIKNVQNKEATIYLIDNAMTAIAVQDHFLPNNWVITCVDNAIRREGTKICLAEADIETVEKTVEKQEITI